MKLQYGQISSYIDRGFGFINSLSLSGLGKKYFFHISKVRKLNIENQLKDFGKIEQAPILLWFVAEKTEKGEELSDCWLKTPDIPRNLIDTFLKGIESTFTAPKKELENINPDINFDFLKKTSPPPSAENPIYHLSSDELKELTEYVYIYKLNSFHEHYKVNNYITKNNLWDNFTSIRSLNDHGESKEIPGILPKYYKIICEVLNISGSVGAPLDKATHY